MSSKWLTRFITIVISLTSLLVFVENSALHAEVVQYENKVIDKIIITVPNAPAGSSFNTSSVLSRIKTQEGDVFTQHQFDNDLKTLALEYDQLDPSLQVVNDKVIITIKVWLKPVIRSIRWNGNASFTSSDLQKELGISPGSIFDRLEFNKAFHKVKAYYVKKGFFEAELNYKIQHEDVSNEVDVFIDIKEGRSGKIEAINFHNFTSEEEEELLEQLVTKKWSMFTSWLTNDGIYNDEAIQQDQFVIVNYLQNRGYADVRVKIDVRDSKSKNRIVVDITAEKGDVYRIGKISIEGHTLFSEEQIRGRFCLRENDAYCPDKIRETIQSITNYYGAIGYIETVVDYEPILRNDEAIYDILFSIDEGEEYRVGLIKVFGNCSTQTNVILNETLLIPGEVFNLTKLQKTEERLRNVGYFKTVNVYAVRTEEGCTLGGNYRDVHIEVEETNTGNFTFSAGFSNIENLFGALHITEKNFNYRGLGRVWRDGYRALRGGGEYAHLSASVGTKSRSYIFSWTKPYFRDTNWVVGFDLEQSNVRYISRDYDINGIGGTVHAKYPINAYLRFGWHYRLRNSTVNVHQNADTSSLLLQEAQNGGLISASGVSLWYDSTDASVRPTCGLRSRIEVEFAGIGGDDIFFGFGYLNTYYYPVTAKSVFKIRGDLKFILPFAGTTYANMAIDERLYLGGDSSVRGYRAYALGPKYPGTQDPRGGLSLNLFSLEYDYRFSRRWEAFVFFDAGHLSKHELNIGDLKTSVGYGVRFTLFESGPPLTVGMGYPIHEKNRGDIKRFFFNIGANF